MSPVDKAVLLKARIGEDLVEIPGVGEVRVRALSRAEVLAMGSDKKAAEIFCLSRGIVEPELTEAEAGQLLEATPGGELQVVVDAIMRLSGLTEGAQKSSREGPGPGGDGPVPLPLGPGSRDESG